MSQPASDRAMNPISGKIVVRITEDNGRVAHQLPLSGEVRDHFLFDFEGKEPACDFWFVRGDLSRTETCQCPPDNVVLLCGEPPAIKRFYSQAFLNQFGAVYGSNPHLRHRDFHFTHPNLAWRVGLDFSRNQAIAHDFEDISNSANIHKTRSLSTVTSNKGVTRGHILRREMVRQLQARFAGRLDFDVFGDGINPIDDKWDALAPYKYHVALENSRQHNYFTEKLIDPFLAEALPFYYGCPNVTDFFPAEAVIAIDLRDPKGAARTILAAIESNQWEKRLDAIREAKRRVLFQYNMLFEIARICHDRPIGPRRTVTLLPEKSISGKTTTFATKAANRIVARFSS